MPKKPAFLVRLPQSFTLGELHPDETKELESVVDLEVRTATIPSMGLGAFAKKRFNKGDTIGYYWGEVMFLHDAERQKHEHTDRLIATYFFKVKLVSRLTAF